MRLAVILVSLSSLFSPLFADASAAAGAQKPTPKHFEWFTGKVTGHNVRMRLQPSLDAQVFKELDRDELMLVTGLVDDFYACMPPKGLKGYIFRTYVLDGVVEGTNVFVRLGADRTSPAVAQLNSGDVVKGTIAPQNIKWLQIDLPEDVRFYVSKDYVQQVGDSSFFAKQESRRQEASKTLTNLEAELDKELEKPFQKIQLAALSQRLNQFINEHKDLPQLVSQAENLISRMQEQYLTRSVAFADDAPESNKVTLLEPKNEEKPVPTIASPAPAKPVNTLSWQEQEKSYLQSLVDSGKIASIDAFYEQELKAGNTLHGIIKPYNSFVSSRPGDFVLLNLKTNLPIAYLYSTKTDLAAWINKSVTIWVSQRPNNNFAFPAYYVLQIEE